MSPPSKETWAIVSRGDSPRVILPFKSKEEAETYYKDRYNFGGLPVAFVKTEGLVGIPGAIDAIVPEADPAPGAFDPVSGAVTLPVPAPKPEKKPPGPAQ
jgi:hypothetical protein